MCKIVSAKTLRRLKCRVYFGAMDKKHFFVQPIGKHLPGVLMAMALLASSSGFGQAVHGGESVIERFLAPDAPAKPMARMWFPDASGW